MGIFDEILAATGMHGTPQAAQHTGAMGAIMDYVNSPQVGGISGLQKMFQEKGLGGVVGSWIGTGQNQPVSADQVTNVLHSGTLQQIAAKVGVDPATMASMMSALLPHLVDKMTPNGQIASGAAAH